MEAAEGRRQVAVSQSISGTGGLRIATGFLSMFYSGPKVVYLPDPTWGNHIPIVEQTGLKVMRYRYVQASRTPPGPRDVDRAADILTRRRSDWTLWE